jgi:hypothetical protein
MEGALMDPDIEAALAGDGGSHVTEMPVQQIEGDPEAGMSAMEKFASRLKNTLRAAPSVGSVASTPAAQAMGAGFDHGVSAGLERRLPGGMGEMAREIDDSGRKTSPDLYGGADMLGMAASPLAVEGKGGGLVGSMGRAAATGGLQASARSLGDDNPDAPASEQAWRALARGSEAAGESAVLAGATGVIGKGASALSSWAGEKADRARTAAIGASGADLGKLAKSKGLEYVEGGNVGRLPEELGLTNKFWGQNAGTYADKFAQAGGKFNEQITGSVADADAALAPGAARGAQRNIVDELRYGAEDPAKRVIGQEDAAMRARLNVAGSIARSPLESAADVRDLKTALYGQTYHDALAGSPESMLGQANEAGGRAAKDELRGLVSQAGPEVLGRFDEGNIGYGKAKLGEELARNAAAKQYAGGGLLGNLGNAAVGAGVGSVIGTASGHPLLGAAIGASYGMRHPAERAAREYGADFGANLGRGLEGVSGGLGGAAETLANSPSMGKLGALMAGDKRAAAQDLSDETKGHLIPQAMQEALQSNKLGPYSDEVARAAMSPEPGALGALYQRLSREPAFNEYRRYLQQLTGTM